MAYCLSRTTVGRIWQAFELKPHRTAMFQLSGDPLLVDKVFDVVGLYLNPPKGAVVLCVDEKSQVQALARWRLAFSMMPGIPKRGPRTTYATARPACSRRSAPPTAPGSVRCTAGIACGSRHLPPPT